MELQIIGPIGYRPHKLTKVCEENVGHKHNYDHVTYLFRGKVRITYRYTEDGQERSGTKEFEAPARIYIKADVEHTIKKLSEEIVEYDCVFSHRDFSGLVVQQYKGNTAAYE